MAPADHRRAVGCLGGCHCVVGQNEDYHDNEDGACPQGIYSTDLTYYVRYVDTGVCYSSIDVDGLY